MIKQTLKIAGLILATLGLIWGCVSVKPNALYTPVFNPNDTMFFLSSEVYHDFLTSEAWSTNSDECISLEAISEAAYRGELGMHLKWTKIKEGCPWLGVGFGWDNWTGKDLAAIKNEAAIEFYVRMIEGSRPNLPWAVGIEDFTGAQAWLGVTANAIKAEKISTEWTRVELPLSEFNWAEQGADASNIKQMIFTLEADGEIYMDEVRIVPYSGGFRKRATISHMPSDQFIIDGNEGDGIWKTQAMNFGNNEVHLTLIEEYLCIALKVKDPDPLQNSNTGKDTYNGDAFEIAFSTDPTANTKRTNFLTTDQHIGFSLSGNMIYSWDWKKERPLKSKDSASKITEDGYIFEAKIKLSEIGLEGFEIQQLYGLEMAVDHGNSKGRYRQERWNDPANDGFYKNPSKWGELYISLPPQAKK